MIFTPYQRRTYRILVVGGLRETDHLEDLGEDEGIKSTWIFMEWDSRH
jgi:RPA family protein